MRRRLMHAMVPTSSSGIPRRRLIWLIGLRERRNAEPRDRAEREAGDQLADGVREVDRYLAARVAETEDQHAARPTVARRYIRSCADLPGERFQSGLARPVPLVG